MKRFRWIAWMLALACAALSGCAGPSGGPSAPDSAASAGSAAKDASTGGAESVVPDGPALTLAGIKAAAVSAGYIVSDGHQLMFMKEVVDGITIEIVADGEHTLYSVVECATEDAAASNAQDIDDAGYSIALRNGRFVSCYSAGNPGQDRKQLLAAILAGEPLPAPPY